MMKKLVAVIVVLLLQGCAVALSSYIPSFWDDNQSAKIITVRLDIERIDCKREQLPQVAKIRDDLAWFKMYSESKGTRQADVLRLTDPIAATAEDWWKRVSLEGHRDNAIYCDLKKRVLTEQAQRAAKAVLGRF